MLYMSYKPYPTQFRKLKVQNIRHALDDFVIYFPLTIWQQYAHLENDTLIYCVFAKPYIHALQSNDYACVGVIFILQHWFTIVAPWKHVMSCKNDNNLIHCDGVIKWIRFPHYRLFARKIHQLLVVELNVELTCKQSVGQYNSFIILKLSSWFVLMKIYGKTQQHLDEIVPERNCVQNFIAHCIIFHVRWYCLSNPKIYAPIQKSLVHH